MSEFSYTILILLIPLLMFVLLGLTGHRMKRIAGYLGTLGLMAVTAVSYYTAYRYFFCTVRVEDSFVPLIGFNFTWLRFTDALTISIGSLLDPISVMMLVVISTVSLMVHIYSLGYMKGEKGFERFFALLSLFSFAMLGLVLATNIFQMYIFWELVGVSSYLLISFYYEKPSAVAAGKKAFIVTRFADLGFLIGILLLSYTTGTFDFISLTTPGSSVMAQGSGIAFMGLSTMTWSLIFVFTGGAGKSAMFPLHIWLPDAMEGPTPVSALIHAATMVVAGVYLVARLFPVYHFSATEGLEVVAWVGAFSSLFAAVIACTQFDIKRVLAYSTMSQIGYMMLALGVSGYGGHQGLGYMASMFHLFTHAMFKALLFLAAGSIIHAVHTNSMNEMGNLRKYLPWTFATFVVALLSICGIPPFSGFWSKDEILVAAFNHNKVLFAIEFLVAGLTAFYMSRLFFSVFFGKKQNYQHTPRESGPLMIFPLVVLALASIFAGFIPFHNLVTSDGKAFETHIEWTVAIPSVVVAMLGIGIAALFYYRPSGLPDKLSVKMGVLYKWAYNKFYMDELYLYVTKKIIFNLISRPVAWFDRHIVDGTMNAVGWITIRLSLMIKPLQSGQLQKYGFVYISGVVLLVLVFVYLITL